MQKETRKQRVLKRRNFLPTFLIAILLWLILATLVYFVEPETFGAVPAFFVLVFCAFLFTFAVIFANTRRGVIVALSTTFFLILRYFELGNILNLILIAALAVTFEFLFSKSS